MNLFFKLRYVPALLFVLMSAPVARAATTPSLGSAVTYGALANTYTNTVIGTTISGDVGFTTGPAVAPAGVHLNYGSGAPYATAGLDQGSALAALAVQPCTYTFAPGAIDLATDVTHGPIGVYTPGVYCTTGPGAASIGAGGITLNGSGTYIFRINGALTTVPGAVITLVGASACDVFWTPVAATTLAANTTFAGTVIDDAGITVGANTTWSGRALAFSGTITTDTDTISVPVCAVVPPVPTPPQAPNNPPLINVRKVPSPLALPAGPGPVTYTYTVTNRGRITMTDITLVDDQCNSPKLVSGDLNNNSWLEVDETWIYTCTTNLTKTTVNFATARGVGNSMASVDTAIAEVLVGVPVVPPLIHILKTSNTSTLPFNGGPVTYTYTVTNPGTEALTTVTVADNQCSGVTRVSGDTNNDSKLQSNETWTYTCTMNVPQTMTNTAIATGQANGLTAIDTALATVVVAGSPVPPMIHVIKKADPIILPATGGWVNYSYTVTNPGTVSLSNVTLTDDKCNGVTAVAGDANGNSLMETNETWTYTCRKYIEYTTMNTATAKGSANGLTVSDIASANVAVAPALLPPTPTPTPVTQPAPKLPNTGFGSEDGGIKWIVVSAGLFVVTTLFLALTLRKRYSK